MHIPDTDSSEFAALMEFVATSGKVRSHAFTTKNADALSSHLLSDRAKAMVESVTALARAAIGRQR